MLSTLVQRQKLWTVPLLVSLAFSWCLMLCQNVAQAASATTEAHSLPPCHSQPTHFSAEQLDETAPAPAVHNVEHCSGCDQQAASAEPLQLALSAIFISWQTLPKQLYPSLSIPVSQLATPPPKPRLPLFLSVNQLRI
ncbi:hypothetical protein LMJ53_13385 [Rheinheimera sp. UJ51]|uniref:hypothetical protein n=1 Tax=Rheinheimera sp. UJ51 TaxID=2892446 RepID=UPI001E508DC3|nr:hypothetical protein [Rheinheimera sp. UJ51]MCC5452715.1 hypothetical protein [Rheinheimera sp. UJ51]